MKFHSVVYLLSAVAAAHAQANDCIRIYQHGQYGGSSTDICSTNTPSMPVSGGFNFNNQISSVRVGSNVGVVTYFDNANFGGAHLSQAGDVERMGPIGFNDRTSSIHYNWKTLPAGVNFPSQGCIFVFQHGAFEGKVTELCQDTADLSKLDFDNQISSVRLGLGVTSVTLYDNKNFGGASFQGSFPSIERLGPLGFNDKTSSIRIHLGACSASDFSVVGPYTSSPEQCDRNGCEWYLETRYADCEEFCNNNGMECESAHVVGEGQSFVGCGGLESAGTTEISCSGDGVPKARYSRVCTCKSHVERSYSPVTDGCKNQNTEVDDACLPVDELAGIRCCSKEKDSDFCGSFCPGGSHSLADYATAVATCAANGLRLCTRAEIDNRDCCGTGCQFDGHQNWILESCDPTCTITDTSVVGPYTSSPQECSAQDGNGCKWYLETRYADCTEFCNDNGLECVGAEVIGDGTSFTGCNGALTNASPINCTGDGIPKARYSRTCTCAVP